MSTTTVRVDADRVSHSSEQVSIGHIYDVPGVDLMRDLGLPIPEDREAVPHLLTTYVGCYRRGAELPTGSGARLRWSLGGTRVALTNQHAQPSEMLSVEEGLAEWADESEAIAAQQWDTAADYWCSVAPDEQLD